MTRSTRSTQWNISGVTPWAAFLLAALLMTGLPAFAGGGHDDDDDDDHHPAVCERSARLMYESCLSEVPEEFKAAKAMCINLEDPLKRAECSDVARESRHEGRMSCPEQREKREEVCELLDEDRYDPEALLDTGNFVADPDDSNPYFSLEPGHTYVARAGDGFEETIIVTVTDEVREVLGVNCRLVVDVVLEEEDGELVPHEVTDDLYALANNGDVHYCGEVARNFEDGALVNLDGSFQAGRDFAKSGILIKAAPMSGDAHRQEYLLGEAEDVIQYRNGADDPTSVGPGEGGENPKFPCNGTCVMTEEFIPPDPASGEFKYFIAGTGFVLGVALEDGVPTGDRDEVVCTGDSLDVLADDPDCGIPAAALTGLLEQLCELSPVAFCD